MEIGEEGELSRLTDPLQNVGPGVSVSRTYHRKLSQSAVCAIGRQFSSPRREGRQSSLVRPPGVDSPY